MRYTNQLYPQHTKFQWFFVECIQKCDASKNAPFSMHYTTHLVAGICPLLHPFLIHLNSIFTKAPFYRDICVPTTTIFFSIFPPSHSMFLCFFFFLSWLLGFTISIGLGLLSRSSFQAQIQCIYIYIYELYWFALNPLLIVCFVSFRFVSIYMSACVGNGI